LLDSAISIHSTTTHMMDRYIRAGGSILDIGGGQGHTLCMFISPGLMHTA
jgi:hypothetical protein